MGFGGILAGALGVGSMIADTIMSFDDRKYNRAMDQKIMEREDTAYQRKYADLAAAGINPILAAGGQPSPTSRPQQQNNKLNTAQNMSLLYGLKKMQEDIKTTRAQRVLLDEQATLQRVLNQDKRLEMVEKNRNWDLAREMGIRSDITSGLSVDAQQAAYIQKKAFENWKWGESLQNPLPPIQFPRSKKDRENDENYGKYKFWGNQFE